MFKNHFGVFFGSVPLAVYLQNVSVKFHKVVYG